MSTPLQTRGYTPRTGTLHSLAAALDNSVPHATSHRTQVASATAKLSKARMAQPATHRQLDASILLGIDDRHSRLVTRTAKDDSLLVGDE